MFFIKNDEIIVYLRYINNKPLFLNVKFVSTSGHRKYYNQKSISFFKKHQGGNANVLLFTSFGLKNLKFVENLSIGGEIICLLYE
jgi:ribosomal protein S8